MVIRQYMLLAGLPGPELCFYLQLNRELTREELAQIKWIIGRGERVTGQPQYDGPVHEIGPRVTTETPFSSNAVNIFKSAHLPVTRAEYSIRYPASDNPPVYDPLTQEIYPAPLSTFDTGKVPEPVRFIPLLA